MAAPFPPWAGTAFRVLLAAVVVAVLGVPCLLMAYVRTPYVTGQRLPVDQPLQFDHRHHVRDDGIDCRYCHFTVENGPRAGIPPAELCLNCHNQIWPAAPILDPVRRSYFEGTALTWKRVYSLPDFVYFDHSIHVDKGVGCEECHGRVDEMAVVERAPPVTMAWCLDCHRNPTPRLRPRERMTEMGYRPPTGTPDYQRELAHRYSVRSLVYCSACHR